MSVHSKGYHEEFISRSSLISVTNGYVSLTWMSWLHAHARYTTRQKRSLGPDSLLRHLIDLPRRLKHPVNISIIQLETACIFKELLKSFLPKVPSLDASLGKLTATKRARGQRSIQLWSINHNKVEDEFHTAQ